MTTLAPGGSPQQAVRAHLGRQYRGVLDEPAIDRHLETYVGLRAAEQLLAEVRSRCPQARELLDVGSGYGSFVLAARQRGLAAVGVEPAGFEREYARARLASTRPDDDPEAVYRDGSGLSLPFADGDFEVVTLWNVLEHVPDTPALLSEAVRVLRPGGRLFLLAPNYAALRREAHYHVPWPPGLPRRLAGPYLRLLGRDPAFFERHVFPCTNPGVLRALARLPVTCRDPREDKLSDPAAINSAATRRAVRALGRLGLVRPARRLLRLLFLNPLRRSLYVEAVKAAAPGGGR